MAINRDDYQDIMDTAASRVPYWARSTNPIVRRHLGFNWRTVPPELRPLLIGVAVWTVIGILGLLIPGILDVTAILFLASIIILPFTGILYARILFTVAIVAADTMQEEMRNNTLSLLRTTPMTLEQIFLGKIAAAIWRHMDDLMLVAQAVVVFSPPTLMVLYMGYWDLQQEAVMFQVVVLAALIVSLVRLILEPIFIGLLAVVIGIVLPSRNFAITATLAVSGFYFVVINLLANLPDVRGYTRLDGVVIPPDQTLIMLYTLVIPVIVPVVLGFLLLRLAVMLVASD